MSSGGGSPKHATSPKASGRAGSPLITPAGGGGASGRLGTSHGTGAGAGGGGAGAAASPLSTRIVPIDTVGVGETKEGDVGGGVAREGVPTARGGAARLEGKGKRSTWKKFFGCLLPRAPIDVSGPAIEAVEMLRCTYVSKRAGSGLWVGGGGGGGGIAVRGWRVCTESPPHSHFVPAFVPNVRGGGFRCCITVTTNDLQHLHDQFKIIDFECVGTRRGGGTGVVAFRCRLALSASTPSWLVPPPITHPSNSLEMRALVAALRVAQGAV
jgi:hypothetical protein